MSSIKDNAFKIMVTMYLFSFILLGVQFIAADIFGYVITINNVELRSNLHTYINQEQLNQYTENITSANYNTNSTYYDKIETFTTAGAFVIWELITLMTGTHIFQVLLILQIPPIFVAIFVIAYILLLARAILGYLNRVD